MRILSVVKAAAVALALVPIAVSAAPAYSYVQLTQGQNLNNLGNAVPSNGAYFAGGVPGDTITLPGGSSTATQFNLIGTIDFLSGTRDIRFDSLNISTPDGAIYANVSLNGVSQATNIDLFQLQFGASDLTFFQDFTFTADGTALYKTLTGNNPGGTKLNSDGSFKSGGSGGNLQGFNDPAPAPEPAAIALLGLGAGMLGLARRRAK